MILLCVLLGVAQVSPRAPLEPLNARLEAAGSLRGSFVRTDYRVLTMETDTSGGTFILASPNLFVLDFTDPPGRKMGCDGEVSYTIEPSSRQVIVYEERRPESFMGTLRSYGDPSMVDSMEVAGDSVMVWLAGRGAGIETVAAGYTLSDSLPFLYSTTDANGNTISYFLESVRAADGFSEGAFGLEVPEGYAVARP